MPQYSVRVKNLDDKSVSNISIWADTQPEANAKALKLARTMLGTANLDIVGDGKAQGVAKALYECKQCFSTKISPYILSYVRCECGIRMGLKQFVHKQNVEFKA